ncbi:16S rRNA (cytidine(1402)-2'-O)-methyltransferase [Alteromonas sp. a30]|uniref:16S rRNA (cytidine(1402)-2'-O)-methyltransferase n=1 Tax=Alteromonas sp. a30 TaxID=2730917 RepID=UPI0022815D1A|nr:16S rRNA (cytidine(1402)-2'-O)-methyltransferase [Alteromonas sp. a30]MCY7294797.1 16S rRNA (cytidine(1402)-2'-O)-methyltransferase [Alteromonas sp. a30]
MGNLYIVATPIGNLEDITFRAVNILKQVDLIAAEDTRHSQKLLQHYAINTPMFALHDHNEKLKSAVLIEKLRSGQDIALISDAGTPLISDPGYHLVSQCREAGVHVVPIPGASAVITAMSAAGLATDAFCFKGFLPVKAVAKAQVITALKDTVATSIFYEAPRRIEDTLKVFQQILPERDLVLAKELTKHYENFVSGTAEHILAWLAQDPAHTKGEFVLMVSGAPKNQETIPSEAIALLHELANLLPLKQAAAVVAKHYDLKKNALYQIGLDQKSST